MLLLLQTDEFKESVVADVLQYWKGTDDDGEGLSKVINDEVDIPQFPNYPAKAPLPYLKPAIFKAMHLSEALAKKVLEVWVASRPEFRDLVARRIGDADVAIAFPDFKGFQLKGYHDWRPLCDEIVEADAGLGGDEVLLMLCCLTGKLHSNDERGMMKKDVLTETLAYLQELPADAPEWGADIPAFLSSVSDLLEAKSRERAEAETVAEFRGTISRFAERHGKELRRFEFDVTKWSEATGLDASVRDQALGLISDLSSLFQGHSDIPAEGSTVAEDRALREKRTEAEDAIFSVKEEIDALLAADEGPDEPPEGPTSGEPISGPGVQDEDPATSTDATLADLRVSEGDFQFDPTTSNHTAVIPNHIDSLVIVPQPGDAAAEVSVARRSPDGAAVTLVHAEQSQHRVENICVGETTVEVTITAEDGVTAQTHTLLIRRAPSDDATLRRLVISAGGLAFEPAKEEYRVELDEEAVRLSFEFEATHGAARVKATFTDPGGDVVELSSPGGKCELPSLPDGQSTLSLTVTAEDGVSARTYSVALVAPSNVESPHTAVLWSLVAKDDLAGAYWISKSLAAEGSVPAHLPTLLKAVQASRWLSPETDDFVDDLFEMVDRTDSPFSEEAHVMLGLAASIQPTLTKPETNLMSWLDAPDRLPSLGKLVSSVRTFADRGDRLGPEHIRGDEWHRRIEDSIAGVSSGAHRWLAESDKRRHKYRKANLVWRALCTEGGRLYEMLSEVARDGRSRVDHVRALASETRLEVKRAEFITEANRSIQGNSRSEITGAARDWLHRGIDEAGQLAVQWCDLVDRAATSRAQSQNQWLSDRVAKLRTEVGSLAQDVLNELATLRSHALDGAAATSSQCLTRSVHGLLDYLDIEHGPHHPAVNSPVVTDLRRVIENSGLSGKVTDPSAQIDIALSKRLLWIPEVDLQDDGLPSNAEAPIDHRRIGADALLADSTLEEVVNSRVANRDYRFLGHLSPEFTTDTRDPEVAYSARLKAERDTLGEHHISISHALDRAAGDGVMEYEGEDWSNFTHELDDILVKTTLNFRPAHDALQAIEGRLARLSALRREELVTAWQKLCERLGSDLGSVDELSETFRLASHRAQPDLRVMDDCVSRLNDYVNSDHDDSLLKPPKASPGNLEAFLHVASGIQSDQAQGEGLRQMVSLFEERSSIRNVDSSSNT